AKSAAVNRQTRSSCRWEALQGERSISLRPLDCLVELIGDGFAYRVRGSDRPDPGTPIFIGKQFRPFQPTRMVADGDGVVVWFEDMLPDSNTCYWMGQECRLEPARGHWPATIVARRKGGASASIRARQDAGDRLRLVIEGEAPEALSSDIGVLRHQVLDPALGATRLRDNGVDSPWSGERLVARSTVPDADILLADNGVRWSWSEQGVDRRRRGGAWIQLLAPDDLDGDALMDVRAAYCEDGVREVGILKSKDRIRVFGSRRDSYQLELERLPAADTRLFLPENTSGFQRQLQAVHRLKDYPLPHHRQLLRLCERQDRAHWPRVETPAVESWFLLKDERWQGTEEQRQFVEKALGTPDLAFLEGPPGSGKTYAICEFVLQSTAKGQRVLLCSSTHVAVDNVLERLIGEFPQIEAVRIGRSDRVDPRVQKCQIDQRIADLTAIWREKGAFPALTADRLEEVAEATILGAANLTCATTTGILAHPHLRRSKDKIGPAWPHFDVLVLDEASKTTFQEFLVPAQLARRWVIVGDVRQLPPFTEPRDLEASFAGVNTDSGQRFSSEHQRACLILFRLSRRESGFRLARWLIAEPPPVIEALTAEIRARRERGEVMPEVVRLAERSDAEIDVEIADIAAGGRSALRLAAADWVLGTPEQVKQVARFLPPQLLPLCELEPDSPLSFRNAHWIAHRGPLKAPLRDGKRAYWTLAELAQAQREFFLEDTWAGQIAWRLGRVHQLTSVQNRKDRERRQHEVDALLPHAGGYATWVPKAIEAIRDVGVRSVIETLRVPRETPEGHRRSALSEAIPGSIWWERAVILTHQHRMHPDISALPRKLFYENGALHDANTISARDSREDWTFLGNAPARRFWIDVAGREQKGVNAAEVSAMHRLLEAWLQYASTHPRHDKRPWEVACLSFYNRQELAIRDMLRGLSGHKRGETRFQTPHSTIVCATVDRFQGREADLVALSLRNTSRAGHMDSPNRLNVAITRARHMLAIVGNHRYFRDACPSEELTRLAVDTPIFVPGP
ncbi:MAG: DEAD/DEAH box helicase, partial [Xanthobacteraceae bacterium]